MTDKENMTCRICSEPLIGRTVIQIECGQTSICGQCWQDWKEMSADIQDQIDEMENARDDEYQSRWDTY